MMIGWMEYYVDGKPSAERAVAAATGSQSSYRYSVAA
jgi:hypothetical protein